MHCLHCDVVFRADLVTGDRYYGLYQNDATMESPFYLANKLASDPRLEPMPTFARGLARLAKLQKPGRLLDVGCSYGAFMEAAQTCGWEVSGVELSKSTSAFARTERHLDVRTGTLEEAAYPDEFFNAVTLWDVIEHLDNPASTLKEIHRILTKNGILLVFTINQRSLITGVARLLYRLSFDKWHRVMALFYDIHHNFFFSPRSISMLLNLHRFRVIDIQFADANVLRWHTVPISPLLIAGSDVIDTVSRLTGNRRYRMFVYARKAPQNV
jgi:SAM-dependent methyltransferase